MSLTRSKAVLELGKRLVTQLEAGDDLLASWMAHNIAQKIVDAEKACGEDKAAAHDTCANSILQLWSHRSVLPGHPRPLGELEPILRTLATLDPDPTEYRYYPQALREAATAEADEETKQRLEAAIGIDYSARLLIRSFLQSAAYRSAEKAEPWVELALQAGADKGAEDVVIKFTLEQSDEGKSTEDKHHASLRDQLSRLEAFIDLADLLAESLRVQLEPDDLEAE